MKKLTVGAGHLFYCVCWNNQWEILIANLRNWRKWFSGYSYNDYKYSKMLVVEFSGITFRKRQGGTHADEQ